ncbi:glutathione peroxidase 7-like isoform X1 [Macrobrachium nipponense]|uniref:glutathione peroxidase 7-like isoform X1 n=1 Tax=Macrobrachium nipponense TaxID=159736 RepID=UPI0030C7DDC7
MIGVKVFVQVLLISFVKNAAGKDFYSYAVKDHEGEDFSLETYRGKVTLVVNVASHCGYTEATYRALKKLHDILSYGDHFSVLAFPCNQFGEQEPLDMPEIINFVTSEYNVEFPIFNKINVIGEDAEPAFRQLTDESSVVPDWNFYKYLVDETGHVIDAWGTATTIESIFDEINFAVEKAKEKSKSTPPATEKKQKPASEAEKNKDEL